MSDKAYYELTIGLFSSYRSLISSFTNGLSIALSYCKRHGFNPSEAYFFFRFLLN